MLKKEGKLEKGRKEKRCEYWNGGRYEKIISRRLLLPSECGDVVIGWLFLFTSCAEQNGQAVFTSAQRGDVGLLLETIASLLLAMDNGADNLLFFCFSH